MYAQRYGAKAPLEWTEAHARVLLLADQLWDDLRAVWIQCLHEQEMAEDATGDAELLSARGAVSRTEAQVDAAFQARRDWRQRHRSKQAPEEIEASIKAAISAAREARRELWPVLKRVRKEIREELLDLWNARDQQMRVLAQGRTRKYTDLHDGVYNDIFKRFRVAAKEGAKQGIVPRPSHEHLSQSIYRQIQPHNFGGKLVSDPKKPGKRRKRIGGSQKGAEWSTLCTTGCGKVRVLPYSPGPRVTQRWGLLVMPVDANGLEIKIPIRVDDREPPQGAQIKGVRVVRRDRKWHTVFSVDAPPPSIERGAGTLYAGLNWRLMADGSLRVLDGIDETGKRYQVCLPRWQLAAVEYAEALQAATDRRAVQAALQLEADHPKRAKEIAEAVRRRNWAALYPLDTAWADGTHGKQGRRQHTALLRARKIAGGDLAKLTELVAEILGDRAGRRRIAGQKSKNTRRRESFYRECAHELAKRFGRLAVAKSDGRKLAKRVDEETGEESNLPAPARRNRQIAAPYSLMQYLRWAFVRAGSPVVDLEAKHKSHTCPICGQEMQGEASRGELYLSCSEHGMWDRDHALAAALWRDDAAGDHERWSLALSRRERPRAKIVRIDEEIGGSFTEHYHRLQYVSGGALEDKGKSRGATRR